MEVRMLTIAPDRRALVTGAASGFGLGVVDRLLEAGGRVAMADFSEGLLRDEADRRGAAVLPIVMDVRSKPAVVAGVTAAVAWLGGLDTVVQCAGVFDYGALGQTTEESWDRQLDTNLKGTFLVAQATMPHLVRSGRGRMVNIASEAGRMGWPLTSAYNASKFGVVGLTQTWAREFGRDGVTVNCVCPAMTPETRQGREVTRQKLARTPGLTEGEVLAGYAANFPIGRAGTVADTADAIMYFLTDNAGWVTGVAFDIDGGGPPGSQPLPAPDAAAPEAAAPEPRRR
jgi:NAD(P)-dependent dehydrogenase (short-subunit alcohol dehydrogenase family)